MFTIYYKMLIVISKPVITDDYGTYTGIRFKSFTSAQIAITKARNKGVEPSRH